MITCLKAALRSNKDVSSISFVIKKEKTSTPTDPNSAATSPRPPSRKPKAIP